MNVYLVAGLVGLLFATAAVYFLSTGVLTSKEVHCPKDEWTTLISNFATGTPAAWELELTAEEGSIISGIYQQQRFFWLFPELPTEGTLQHQMRFHRKWINARYILKVKPDVDLLIRLHNQ